MSSPEPLAYLRKEKLQEKNEVENEFYKRVGSFEMLKARKGYDKGLKYLVSKNFPEIEIE